MRSRLRGPIAVVLGVLWAGCGEDGGEAAGGTPADADVDAADTGAEADPGDSPADGLEPLPPIDWAPCPDLDPATISCATAQVPLDHDDAESPLIAVYLRRFASNGPRRRQMWFLNGGPGETGPPDLELYRETLPGTEVLALGFRGTEGPERLECAGVQEALAYFDPQDEAVISDCRAELEASLGDDLRHYAITADARDLVSIVGRTREEGVPLFLMGVSFGSMRALRVLDVAPDLFEGVILDYVTPADTSWMAFDGFADAVAERTFELCAMDEDCASHFGPDPWADAQATIARIRAGHCPTSLDLTSRDYQRLLYQALELRGLLPSLVYRIGRCDAGDVATIEHMAERLARFDANVSPIELLNLTIHVHLIGSELRPDALPTPSELEEDLDALLVTKRESPGYRMLYEVWPEGPSDPLRDRYPDTDLPLLMFHGELDPVGSLAGAEAVGRLYQGASQHLLVVPNRSHVPFGTTPCVRELVDAFLSNPVAPLDTSCLPEVSAVTFSNDVFATLYGTDDTWD